MHKVFSSATNRCIYSSNTFGRTCLFKRNFLTLTTLNKSKLEKDIFHNNLVKISQNNNFHLNSLRQLSVLHQNLRSKKGEVIDTLGTWDHKLELPLMMDASIKHGAPIPQITKTDIGSSSVLGKRKYQEDRILVSDLTSEILCCAVFDGHGGSSCSEFCSKNIEDILKDELEVHHNLQTVLHNTFLKLHDMYMKTIEDQSTKTGTTATVCLLRGGVELVVGHVGDSSALLCRLGNVRRLTQDHCPSFVSEKNRIEQSGGEVSVDNVGRHMVNSSLNMSRSLGDPHLKPYGVIAVPDTRSVRIKHGKDAFLVLLTDGINFAMTDDEICKVINNAEDPSNAATSLVHQATSMSSEDNCSAIVVPLGSWGKYTTSASMFYSFGIGRDMSKSSRFG